MISQIPEGIVHFFESGLFIDEMGHAFVSFLFAVFLYSKTKSIKLSLITFITTFAIDSDHLIDYFLYYGDHFSLLKFLSGDYFDLSGKAYVLFHAWEWVVILFVIGRKVGRRSNVYTALSIGVLGHLIWDAYMIDSVIFYSIIYRYLAGFVL